MNGVELIGHGDVLIAAITSCTNTSNPSVMLAAGLLAKKAVDRGLTVRSTVKNSLAPGSRVVTDYLERTGLQPYLNELGFNLVGYGCTTCIGNSGPLDPAIEQVLNDRDVIAASVLSGNRNFEARVHQSIKANFLMSPPLVVAFALAGRIDVDLSSESLGTGKDGKEVYLSDIWPSLQEINDLMRTAFDPETYRRLYSNLNRMRCGMKSQLRRAKFTNGIWSQLTLENLLTLKGSAALWNACPTSKAHDHWRSLAIRLLRTTSAPQGRSKHLHRPVCICKSGKSISKISTAMVHAEGITR